MVPCVRRFGRCKERQRERESEWDEPATVCTPYYIHYVWETNSILSCQLKLNICWFCDEPCVRLASALVLSLSLTRSLPLSPSIPLCLSSLSLFCCCRHRRRRHRMPLHPRLLLVCVMVAFSIYIRSLAHWVFECFNIFWRAEYKETHRETARAITTPILECYFWVGLYNCVYSVCTQKAYTMYSNMIFLSQATADWCTYLYFSLFSFMCFALVFFDDERRCRSRRRRRRRRHCMLLLLLFGRMSVCVCNVDPIV